MFELNKHVLREHIRAWLQEDLVTGDISSLATIPMDHMSKGIIHVKESGVIAGLPAAAEVFKQFDPDLSFHPLVQEGVHAPVGTVIAEVEGSTRSILSSERLALNLLQRMSGVATKTKSFVDALEGVPVRLVDTRKTTPGHRALEKYAVRVGGGHNHRLGLYDAVMIKDNHIKASGGITSAVQNARNYIPHTMKIEVETESLEQTREALEAGADIIMLDNMSTDLMKQAVHLVKSAAPHIIVEASGGVSLATIRAIALTGVDVISVGALTNSISALDISLDLGERKGAKA